MPSYHNNNNNQNLLTELENEVLSYQITNTTHTMLQTQEYNEFRKDTSQNSKS